MNPVVFVLVGRTGTTCILPSLYVCLAEDGACAAFSITLLGYASAFRVSHRKCLLLQVRGFAITVIFVNARAHEHACVCQTGF